MPSRDAQHRALPGLSQRGTGARWMEEEPAGCCIPRAQGQRDGSCSLRQTHPHPACIPQLSSPSPSSQLSTFPTPIGPGEMLLPGMLQAGLLLLALRRLLL